MKQIVVDNSTKNYVPSSFWNDADSSISSQFVEFSASHVIESKECPKGDIMSFGAKCGADRELELFNFPKGEAVPGWIEEGRAERFEKLLSSVKETRLLYLYRRNTLDWFSTVGGARGSDRIAVRVNIAGMIKAIKDKIKADEIIEKELEDLAKKYNHPFMSIVYEDLCVNMSKTMKSIYEFLGHTNETQVDIANSKPNSVEKKHRLKHKDMYSNYNQVVQALTENGLEYLLKDEDCTMIQN
jgi:hypothetical protein